MDKQTYTQYKSELAEEQQGLPKDQIMEQMSSKSEFAIDLDNLPKQQHNWIKRGIKVSCEGAMHPYHSHFLVRR